MFHPPLLSPSSPGFPVFHLVCSLYFIPFLSLSLPPIRLICLTFFRSLQAAQLSSFCTSSHQPNLILSLILSLFRCVRPRFRRSRSIRSVLFPLSLSLSFLPLSFEHAKGRYTLWCVVLSHACSLSVFVFVFAPFAPLLCLPFANCTAARLSDAALS